MSWLTVIWSMAASASLTLALMHLAIWIKQRNNLSHLLFSVAAIAVAGIAAGELAMMLPGRPSSSARAAMDTLTDLHSHHLFGWICASLLPLGAGLACLVSVPPPVCLL